ncbi:MAG: hypothetical protein K9N23_01530 [Akkermansiaceae bacterium]|nr:hypothetical protein [Akkermansiaceae bacterium]MCF7730331.1 hypothetical protein [Akkermansiaceae bacterium]
MKLKTTSAYLLGVGAILTASANAGTLVFSGRTWTTNEPAANSYGTQPAYTLNDSASATATGAWNLWAGAWTTIAINVGDTVSYDYFLTKELRNTYGGGASDYIEDSWAGFLSPSGGVLDPPTFTYTTEKKAVYGNDASTLTVGGDIAPGTTPGTGIHFDWTFDSDTSYTLNVTDIATSTPIASAWTGSLVGTTDDIEAFTFGAWNTEQDVTVANFLITPIPEPAAALLGGLGLLTLLRRRR